MANTANDNIARQRELLIETLRAYGTTYGGVGRQFATSLGLHHSDATALVEILAAEEQGTPLSPARLSERIGLTGGATSSLLNRLEDAGYLVRTREHTDRRIVTLHSTPEIQRIADGFFHPLGDRLDIAMNAYPAATLANVAEVITELRTVMDRYINDVEKYRTAETS